jgi:peptide-methionine (S)-S-oxide reductase
MKNSSFRSSGAKFAALIFLSLTLSLQSCGNNPPAKTSTTKPNETIMNNPNLDTITLAGGCYWCIEAIYQRLQGVVSVESGFSGGNMKNPSYRDVCTGNTGHAESVQITYDKTKTSLDEIFKVFFTVHDPTTLNRQGADAGTQYRSAIFYRNEEQKKAAQDIIAALTQAKVYSDPIVTEVTPFTVFYKAEDYHQDYYNQHGSQPYCQIVIRPKVEKFEKVFADRLKNLNTMQ